MMSIQHKVASQGFGDDRCKASRPGPTVRARCAVLVRIGARRGPRRKARRSSRDPTPIVLSYPSWVSWCSVGRQVRVDLEGVAEGDSVLAGSPADGLAGERERHSAVGGGPRLRGAGFCAVPLWKDAPEVSVAVAAMSGTTSVMRSEEHTSELQ